MREKNPLRIARSRLDAAFLCEKMREGEAERLGGEVDSFEGSRKCL